jgi:hypothetical protein
VKWTSFAVLSRLRMRGQTPNFKPELAGPEADEEYLSRDSDAQQVASHDLEITETEDVLP